MILIVIGVVSIIQVIAYLLMAKLEFKYGRTIIFLAVLAAYLFFLPKLFYPKLDANSAKCGMPILGITLAFWIFGWLSASLTHLIYGLTIKKKE